MKRIFHCNGCEIVKHCKGCYELRFMGKPVLCRCSLRCARAYFFAEFAD